MRFARLLDLPNEMQFLIVRSVSDDAGKPIISIFAPPPAKLASKGLGVMLYRQQYDSEKTRDEVFDNYTVNNAIEFLNKMAQSLIASNNIILPNNDKN